MNPGVPGVSGKDMTKLLQRMGSFHVLHSRIADIIVY
jgi:5'-3' exonuclease